MITEGRNDDREYFSNNRNDEEFIDVLSSKSSESEEMKTRSKRRVSCCVDC